ncbi:hypothetical protein ABTE06_22135, partial [Acinetobacter baumannii]
QGGVPHPAIALPQQLYGQERKNSSGIDLSNESRLQQLGELFVSMAQRQWQAAPLIAGELAAQPAQAVRNPADHREIVGQVSE